MTQSLTSIALSALVAGSVAASCAAEQTPAVAMSAAWAQGMCEAWSADATLTGKRVESEWIKNDAGVGSTLA